MAFKSILVYYLYIYVYYYIYRFYVHLFGILMQILLLQYFISTMTTSFSPPLKAWLAATIYQQKQQWYEGYEERGAVAVNKCRPIFEPLSNYHYVNGLYNLRDYFIIHSYLCTCSMICKVGISIHVLFSKSGKFQLEPGVVTAIMVSWQVTEFVHHFENLISHRFVLRC